MSLPLRECGLKYNVDIKAVATLDVTPIAGVWIEMVLPIMEQMTIQSHSHCGSVD